MKYANIISKIGAIIIIAWAILKILHIEVIHRPILIILGLVLTFAGQAWEIKLLKDLVKQQKSSNSNPLQ